MCKQTRAYCKESIFKKASSIYAIITRVYCRKYSFKKAFNTYIVKQEHIAKNIALRKHSTRI